MNAELLLNLKADTIDGVIQSLDRIISWSRQEKSRLGYFPALYRKVTVRVREGIEEGLFDDGQRMERLDVIFANRYLEAFEQYHICKDPVLSWKLVFDATKRWRPIVFQHLLLGMNAHIELDLGIAAAETADGGNLSDLQNDFDKINQILASLVNDVQMELSKVWPLLKLLDYAVGEADENLVKFGMKIARGDAWSVAQEISVLPKQKRALKIAELDHHVAEIGKMILNPGYIVRLVLFLIRIGELRSVPRIIEILQ
jgi:hypothetical protein